MTLTSGTTPSPRQSSRQEQPTAARGSEARGRELVRGTEAFRSHPRASQGSERCSTYWSYTSRPATRLRGVISRSLSSASRS